MDEMDVRRGDEGKTKRGGEETTVAAATSATPAAEKAVKLVPTRIANS
jgi:hypothetical protein